MALPEVCSAGMTRTRCRDRADRGGQLSSPRAAAMNAARLAPIASGIGTSDRSSSALDLAGDRPRLR